MERIWLLPLGADPLPIPDDILGELVLVQDRGDAIVVHGVDRGQVERVGDAVIAMVGGAHG